MNHTDDHSECRRPLIGANGFMFLSGILLAFAAGLAIGTSLDLFKFGYLG